MKIRSTTLDHHEEPPIGDVRGDVSLSPLKCLITPETPPRRLSYLPSSPQGRKIIPPLVTCSTPSTPTHRLRPAMESLESPLSMSSWIDQSPCSTPTTPRRRLAALLDTPGSNLDRSGGLPSVLLVNSHCTSPRKQQQSSLFSSLSSHSSGHDPVQRRLPKLSSLDGPSPVPPSSSENRNSLSPRKRKPRLSLDLEQALVSPRCRKQEALSKKALLPPLLNDSTKLLETSWSTFPDISSNDLGYDSPKTTVLSTIEADALILKVQKFISDQNRYKKELEKSKRRLKKVAKARFEGGNETGATLAVKKFKKIGYELKRVDRAVGIATDALTQMEQEIFDAKYSKENFRHRRVDFGSNVNVLDETEAILTECPQFSFSKDYLLKEVQSWCIPIGV